VHPSARFWWECWEVPQGVGHNGAWFRNKKGSIPLRAADRASMFPVSLPVFPFYLLRCSLKRQM
jgi:hypothetical protein